jgi:hypothetical protein
VATAAEFISAATQPRIFTNQRCQEKHSVNPIPGKVSRAANPAEIASNAVNRERPLSGPMSENR